MRTHLPRISVRLGNRGACGLWFPVGVASGGDVRVITCLLKFVIIYDLEGCLRGRGF